MKKREKMSYDEALNKLLEQKENDEKTEYHHGEYAMRLCVYDALLEEWDAVIFTEREKAKLAQLKAMEN